MSPSREFSYKPDEYEAEKASNSYLILVITVKVGLLIPVISLLAIVLFYFSNRKSRYFVRWHCTQALLSQVITLGMNIVGMYWTLIIIFGAHQVTNNYIAYMITIIISNIVDFIATVYAAVETRKGRHVSWWFFGPLTDILVKA
jgi:membrane-associated HD superfamily phosphohydrolase